MIISRTPFRMSFFGGGTDYPTWFEKHGGAVLSTTFDKYSYITCRWLPPFFDHKYRISYSKMEHVKSAAEIQHPAIREVLLSYEQNKERITADGPYSGVEIHCDADLPARSGLGSSSAFMVGLLHSLEGLHARRVTSRWLADEAIRYEREVLRETVGNQDQVAAAYGGLNIIRFDRDGRFKVDPLILSKGRRDEFTNHLMLFFTGFSRIASQVAKKQVGNFSDREKDLHEMRQMVDDGCDILSSQQDIRKFGELLHAGWERKRNLADCVSTEEIDNIYARARAAGAIGGKLLGAGGGGFMLLFVSPQNRNNVRAALGELIHVPFSLESTGSQIIYYRM